MLLHVPNFGDAVGMRMRINRMRKAVGAALGLAFVLGLSGLLITGRISAQAARQVNGQTAEVSTEPAIGRATGQAPTPEASQAQRPTSTPYKGDLSIFEYPDRDKRLHVDRVMDLLGIVPGKIVADIGAGSGWFTVRAAARVGV